MPRSKDTAKPAKKVRLTYCIATSANKPKKGMNSSRNWANKSLNKSRVLMRSMRANNAALAKKLNEVQVELSKYERENSILRDLLQSAQQENRTKEACLRDLYSYFSQFSPLILSIQKRIVDGLRIEDDVSMSATEPQRTPENPFVSRDKIPRTPPENAREAIRQEISQWMRKDQRKDKSEVEKTKKRRSEAENQLDVKQMTMISESPRKLDKSLEKNEQLRRNPDVLVEKMLNDLMSHGINDSMEEEITPFPLSPSVSFNALMEGRRSRSPGLSRRLSTRRNSSPRADASVPFQETVILAPATPKSVQEMERIRVAETSQQPKVSVSAAPRTSMTVSRKSTESSPVIQKNDSIVPKATNKKRKNSTKPKPEKERKKKVRVCLPVSDDVKSTVNDKRNAIETSQKVLKDVNMDSEALKTETKRTEVQSDVAVGRSVVVESKKPGILKFSAPKQGECAEIPKRKKSKKKINRPAETKQIVKETTTEKPKSVFDFSMSDTMNETSKVLPPYSEFREKSNEQVFVKPVVTTPETTKTLAAEAMKQRLETFVPQTPAHDNDENDVPPNSTRSRRGAKVNYKEPGINKKIRRGDPQWCRHNST